jgi:hypothetical protein
MQAIHRKARELLEERGIRAGYLAAGLARWDELFLEPAAPVLLRGLTNSASSLTWAASPCGHPARPGTASYRDSGSVRDRDRLRKEHLGRLGWRFHRLWSTNWFRDPDAEVARLRQAYDQAVAASPRAEPHPGPAPSAKSRTRSPSSPAALRSSRAYPHPAGTDRTSRSLRAPGPHRAAQNRGGPGSCPPVPALFITAPITAGSINRLRWEA